MYVEVNNRKIHLQQDFPASSQQKHAIVLIHGLGQNLQVWNPIVPYLKDFHIIRYDLAGHGASGVTSQNVYHIKLFADDLYEMLNQLHASKVSLVGYGLGASIAIKFSQLYPELVHRIVSIANPIFYPPDTRKKRIDHQLNDMRTKGLRPYILGKLQQLTIYPDNRILEEAYLSVSINTYEAILSNSKNYEMSVSTCHQSHPVLHLIGEWDTDYPPELIFKAMQYVNTSILVLVPEAKSLVHIDNPSYTAQRIISFIQSEERPRSIFVEEAISHYDALTKSRLNRRDEYHLRVDVIKRFEARINGQLLEGNWKIRKAQELLIYLMYNKSVPREKLYDQFWPHLNLENARNMLRVSINHLKNLIDKPFGTSFIHSQRDSIELRGNVESDLIELLQDIQHFHSSRSDSEKEQIARKISQAVSADILEGYYNDTIIYLREEIINMMVPIIKWIANRYEQQGRLLDSILYYKLMLSILPDEIELIQKIATLYDELQLKALSREWQERYDRELHDDD